MKKIEKQCISYEKPGYLCTKSKTFCYGLVYNKNKIPQSKISPHTQINF